MILVRPDNLDTGYRTPRIHHISQPRSIIRLVGMILKVSALQAGTPTSELWKTEP